MDDSNEKIRDKTPYTEEYLEKMIEKKEKEEDNIRIARTCYNSSIELFMNDISNINVNNHGSETQATGSDHEEKVSNILRFHFKAERVEKKKFREFIKLNGNGRQWNTGKDSFNRVCDESLEIKNNPLQLIDGLNYIIDQPGGGQDYPDCVMINLNNNILQFVYIECKGATPKFNNNPPKMNKNCIYICGNKIFNGFILTTQEWQDRKNNFIQMYNALAQEYTSEDMKIIPYRVIELNWVKDRGPQYFIDREEQNIPLITACLSRFVVIP